MENCFAEFDNFRFLEMFSVTKNINKWTVDERLLPEYHAWHIEPQNTFFLNYEILDCGQNVYMTLSDEENIYNLHQWFNVRNFFTEPIYWILSTVSDIIVLILKKFIFSQGWLILFIYYHVPKMGQTQHLLLGINMMKIIYLFPALL